MRRTVAAASYPDSQLPSSGRTGVVAVIAVARGTCASLFDLPRCFGGARYRPEPPSPPTVYSGR